PLWQPLWHRLWRGDVGVSGREPPVFRDRADEHPVRLGDDGRHAGACRGHGAGRVGARPHGGLSAGPGAVDGAQFGGGARDPAPGILRPGADPALGGVVAAGGPFDNDATIQVVTETTGWVTPADR